MRNEAIIKLAKSRRLPDQLSLRVITTLAFEGDAAINTIDSQQFYSGLCAAIDDGLLTPIAVPNNEPPSHAANSFNRLMNRAIARNNILVHRNEVRIVLESLLLWPLPKDNLLGNWWQKTKVTRANDDELLKIIGVLTLALAETKRTYKKRSGDINKGAIVASVQGIIDAVEIDMRWKSQSKLYDVINNALDALEKSN